MWILRVMFDEVKKVRQRSISITAICFFLLVLFLPSIARCGGWVTTDQGAKVSLDIWMEIVSTQNTTAQWSGAKDAKDSWGRSFFVTILLYYE